MNAEKNLGTLRALAEFHNVSHIANTVLDNPKFLVWSGSSKPEQHHYGKGGLIEHTREVVELCLVNNEFFRGVDKHNDNQQVYLAALFHDVGKIWDYEPVDAEYKEWRGGVHKRQVHHIARSAIVWSEASKGLEHQHQNDVLHAILAHHGLREWGSPVAPATRLAWLLHLCDNLSARMDDCYRIDRK